MKKILVLLLAAITLSSAYSQETIKITKESKEEFDQRMEWWRNAKFGMFIHWGAYSVPAGRYHGKKIKGVSEWIMITSQVQVSEYEEYAKQFNPKKFNAEQWVKLIKDSGMKYLVITSKHHDGFALWGSKVSDYNVVDFAPYGKDILKALSEECKKQGIKFGVYYSIMDWHHPDAQRYSYINDDLNRGKDNKENFKKYYAEYMKPQLKEIMDNYDPDILWFDGEWTGSYTHELGLDLYAYLRNIKPSLLINNRVDKGRDGMRGMNKTDIDYVGDFGTPEQEILGSASAIDWESCMTMNDSWGFKKDDDNWKSSEELIHNLIDVTVKGGNYLLNVGPTAEGVFPNESISRLNDIGNWLKINSEAIYNTEMVEGDYKQGKNLFFSKKKGADIFYVISTKKPKSKIKIKNIQFKKSSSVYLLGNDKPLKWEQDKGTSIIFIPKELRKTWNDKSFAWVFKVTSVE